jgi:hypothetical protein
MRLGTSFEALRDLSAAIWTLRSTQESAKILRTTTSLLRYAPSLQYVVEPEPYCFLCWRRSCIKMYIYKNCFLKVLRTGFEDYKLQFTFTNLPIYLKSILLNYFLSLQKQKSGGKTNSCVILLFLYSIVIANFVITSWC